MSSVLAALPMTPVQALALLSGLALPVSWRLFLRLASCVMIAAERSEEILQA